MKRCKVAVAQIKVGNLNSNIKTIKKFIKKARKKQADIVVFPETCVYVHPSEKPSNFSKYLKEITEECKNNSIWCIFTSYTLSKDKKYNTAFLINRKGEIIYKYNKKHPWISETKLVTPGKSIRIIETDEFGKIGIIICSDIGFPNDIKKMSKKGAWIIFCPSYDSIKWETPEIHKDLPLIRAYDNSCYFIVCDAFTKETISISTIASPSKVLQRIIKKPGIVIQDLDYNKILKLRNERKRKPIHE